MSDNCPQKSGLRRRLYIIIFEADTFAGQLFDIVLLWSILLSVLLVVLDSDPDIAQALNGPLFIAEWIFTILFSIEYLLRIYVSRKPIRYIFSFFGLVDLLSVLPTYLSLMFPGTQYLMVIRVLRLLRVFRIFKLARYLKESDILLQALKASQIKITVFIGAVLSIVLIVGTLMHLVEGSASGFTSIPRGMYWAIVTVTTVGYGDLVPVTTFGKFIASMLMLMGYGIIAVPTGIVSSELVQQNRMLGFCKQCGASHRDADNFCANCGASLRSNDK